MVARLVIPGAAFGQSRPRRRMPQRLACAHATQSLAMTVVSYGRICLFGLLVVGLGACRPSRESVTAGQIGCNPSEIQISDEDTSMGWGQSTETWTAECGGRTFVCSQLDTSTTAIASNGKAATTIGVNSSDVSCHERLADTPTKPSNATAAANEARARAVPTAPPPTGGAGFELGADMEGLRQVCETAGHTWGTPSKGRATCSGTAADLGFPADVALKFCSGKACIVTLHHRPESEWTSTFSELKGKLTAKYGAASESEAVIPAGCRTEPEFIDCLNKNVRLRFSWNWPTGERVILSIGKAEPESDAAIRIDYTRPVRKVAANADAL